MRARSPANFHRPRISVWSIFDTVIGQLDGNSVIITERDRLIREILGELGAMAMGELRVLRDQVARRGQPDTATQRLEPERVPSPSVGPVGWIELDTEVQARMKELLDAGVGKKRIPVIMAEEFGPQRAPSRKSVIRWARKWGIGSQQESEKSAGGHTESPLIMDEQQSPLLITEADVTSNKPEAPTDPPDTTGQDDGQNDGQESVSAVYSSHKNKDNHGDIHEDTQEVIPDGVPIEPAMAASDPPPRERVDRPLGCRIPGMTQLSERGCQKHQKRKAKDRPWCVGCPRFLQPLGD